MSRAASLLRSALGALSVAFAALSCGSDTSATATSDPVDPAGVWNFSIVNTVTTGACAGEAGDSSLDPITITKTGSRAPYSVTAKGFLGVQSNVLTGTFSSSKKLTISGSYAEDGGTTTTTHTLTATTPDR
ncbi:MAG TPA: hypothetical protein VE967_11610, partial [Gemmatimonadaceae bacterium]|nr:hypothetical protein [Gemmatimonadaceae bacterium]